MAPQDILIKKGIIEKKAGVVVFDLAKFQAIERNLEEYKRKERLLKSLENFENLARWGRDFAARRNITKEEVLEND